MRGLSEQSSARTNESSKKKEKTSKQRRIYESLAFGKTDGIQSKKKSRKRKMERRRCQVAKHLPYCQINIKR